MEADLKKAHEKIEQVLLRLYRCDAMMLRALCLVDKVPDKAQKTIGLDVRTNPPTLRYNPEFINVLSARQLELVLASEGFKIMFRHCTTRLRTPRTISALASQITVDHFIVGSEFMTDELVKYFPTADMFGMDRNLWFEKYFENLKTNFDDVVQKIKATYGKPGDAKGGGGKGQGNFMRFEDSNDALREYFNPESTNSKDWATNDRFNIEVERVVEQHVRSGMGWGDYTGNARGAIEAALKPKINYKELLKRFYRSVESVTSTPSRMKLNRRYGLASPGYRRDYITEVMFAIDASGSMSDDDLKEGFAVVNSTCRHAKVHYMLFDTRILAVETDMKKAKRTFKIHGRGGTNFQQVIDYANKNKLDGIIIYTDGIAPAPTEPRRAKKVLWLMSQENQHPPVDWGYRAHLNRFISHV